MKARLLTYPLLLILCLTGCAGKAATTPLSPEQQAYAQTQFVQQAATSAAAFARTAQPSALPANTELPTGFVPGADTQTPGVPTSSSTIGMAQQNETPPPAALEPTPINTQPFSPTNTRTSAPNPTPTRTPAPSATNTPTSTATQASGWQGDWIITFQKDDGSYLSGEMSVSLNGIQLLAEAEVNGSLYQFNGQLRNNGQLVFGTWSTTQTSGSFTWTLVSASQFGGDRNLLYGICGARAGEEMPDPCYIPPLS
ncbi:MAG TPA: hypothetical protein PLV20_06200 [Anaerolineaceae bacterium]|jgi:hypothetical protein|nr:hypothetical protein [Anaerolineaceae bacterium]